MSGIVRKIDDLGRIVIPKEIRGTLNIKNNDELEIYVENNKVILEKYRRLYSFIDYSKYYVNLFEKISKKSFIVCDMEKIIVCSENYKELCDMNISDKLYKMCVNRTKLSDTNLQITKNKILESNYYFVPIINNIDVIGSIILVSTNEITDIDIYTANIIKALIEEKLKVD